MPRFMTETICFLNINQSYGIFLSKSFLPQRMRWFLSRVTSVECSPGCCPPTFVGGKLAFISLDVVQYSIRKGGSRVGICASVFSTGDLVNWVGEEIRD